MRWSSQGGAGRSRRRAGYCLQPQRAKRAYNISKETRRLPVVLYPHRGSQGYLRSSNLLIRGVFCRNGFPNLPVKIHCCCSYSSVARYRIVLKNKVNSVLAGGLLSNRRELQEQIAEEFHGGHFRRKLYRPSDS